MKSRSHASSRPLEASRTGANTRSDSLPDFVGSVRTILGNISFTNSHDCLRVNEPMLCLARHRLRSISNWVIDLLVGQRAGCARSDSAKHPGLSGGRGL